LISRDVDRLSTGRRLPALALHLDMLTAIRWLHALPMSIGSIRSAY
jgi:hypothetical protein